MSEYAINLKGVTKRFRDKVAVRDLDLQVPSGSLCGFLGPNGAGKTTTIRMVMSIFYPDEGELSVLGRASAEESKDKIGYLPEERGVYKKMRVGEFLAYIAKLKGMGKGGLNKSIEDWLEKIGLPETRKKRCEELSKGMQQKVQFLASIIHDPELIILDEPFSGLDPVNARLLRELIDEQHKMGKTIIFSTHVLHQAEQICQRVFMINNGRKILDGPLEGIYARFDPKTVIIEASDGESIGDRIATFEGVRSVSASAGSAVELHLNDGADPGDVMRRLMSELPLRRVELRRATLEDIFVGLVDPGDSEDSVRAALTETATAGGVS